MRKLTAILAAFVGVLILPTAFATAYGPINAFFFEGPTSTKVMFGLLTAIPLVASCAIATFLIAGRERIASRLVPGEGAPPTVTAPDLIRAGLVLLGIYLVATAIPALISIAITPAANYLQAKAITLYGEPDYSQLSLPAFLLGKASAIISALASLGIGSYLIARRERVVSWALGLPIVEVAEPLESVAVCGNCGAGYDPADYDGGVSEARCMNCKEPLGIPRT